MARQRVPKQLRDRVAYWQQRLLLTDWKVKIKVGKTTNDCKAESHYYPEYKEATLEFNLDTFPQEELDSFIVHELAHCIVAPLAQLAVHLAGEDKKLEKVIDDSEDGVVTHVERAIQTLDNFYITLLDSMRREATSSYPTPTFPPSS